MSYQARYIGLDEVLDAFQKKAKAPYFSLWIGTKLICDYSDGDQLEDVAEKLTEEIERSIKRNITHVHELILHNKKEKNYTRKSEHYCVIAFQCLELPGVAGLPADPNAYTIAAMHSEVNKLRSEISALQAERIEEDDDDQEPDAMQGIGKFFTPEIIGQLINRILPPVQTTVSNLAGINPDQTLQETINVLFAKGVKLEHLQKLAAMPTERITMLISML